MTRENATALFRGWAASAALVMCVLATACAGCASLRPMTTSPGDLADYRSFRVAAAEGTRLRRAKEYLARHPEGAFADEVRAAFDEEEPRFFEAAQGSREAARRYLADLPEGPHATAALALLTALESNMREAELADIGRRVRYEDATLEGRARQRRAVGETILGALGVLLDDGVFGLPRAEGTRALGKVLAGSTPSTWGAAPGRREEDLFFVLPTRPERESRLLTLVIAVTEEGGVVTAASLEGSDMFVRWAEADLIVRLDPSAPEDRTEAQVHAMDRLGGALERRFPLASCPDKATGRELAHRACEGWEVVVVPGKQAGDDDSIVIRGRRATSR